jgi:hypothetical protein
MRRFIAIIAGAIIASAFGIFVVIAQAQLIFVPFFTPTRIEIEGLESQYPANGSMAYTISLKGYGSNCIAFEASIFRVDVSLPQGEERIAYFGQKQDCRIINVSQGQYNYSKSFSYIGNAVLGKSGDYKVEAEVVDQITGHDYVGMHFFTIVQRSSHI